MPALPLIPHSHPVVVVVDDLVGNLVLMTEAMHLTEHPLPLLTLHGGAKALQYVSELLSGHGPCPQLIFLDLAMPGINGFAVLSMLKQHPDTATIHVCMCSTSTDRHDITQARLLGANSYVEKPMSFEGIITLLNDAERWIQAESSSHYHVPFPQDLISSTPPSTRMYQVS